MLFFYARTKTRHPVWEEAPRSGTPVGAAPIVSGERAWCSFCEPQHRATAETRLAQTGLTEWQLSSTAFAVYLFVCLFVARAIGLVHRPMAALTPASSEASSARQPCAAASAREIIVGGFCTVEVNICCSGSCRWAVRGRAVERKGWPAALRVSSCRVATITFPDPHFRDVPSLRSKRLVCVPVPDLSHTVSTKSFKQLLFEGRGRNLRRKGLKRQQFLGIAL